MRNFVFIAPPAAGKGTQSKFLVEKYGYNHISTGDLLREEVANKTTLGIQIEEIMSSGKLVDDEIVLTLLKNKLSSVLSSNKPFIIDGFPRTPIQAEMLNKCLSELNVDNYSVIYMDLDYEEAKKRVLGRLVCPKCGKSFNDMVESLMPKVSGICDSCSSSLEKRSDDTEETFKIRFDTYMRETSPIIEYYQNKNLLKNIDADQDINDIINMIEGVIK